jgi:hypothetical protein
MSNETSTIDETIVQEIRKFIEPIELATQSERGRKQLFAELGWDIDALTGLPINDLVAAFDAIVTATDRLLAQAQTPPESLEEIVATLSDVGKLVEAIGQVKTIVGRAERRPPDLEAFGRELIEHLAVVYLFREHRTAFSIGVLLGVIDLPSETPRMDRVIQDPSTGAVLRGPEGRPELRLNRLVQLLADPDRAKDEFLQTGLATNAQANTVADELFPQLATLLIALGADVRYGLTEDISADFAIAGLTEEDLRLGDRMLTFSINVGDLDVGATITIAPREEGGPALVVAPFGATTVSQLFGMWAVTMTLTGEAGAFALRSNSVTLVRDTDDTGETEPAFFGRVELAKVQSEGRPAIRIGPPDGTRLDVGSVSISADADLRSARQRYGVLAGARESRVVVSPSNVDGFLRSVLPPDGLGTAFDLGLGWSSNRGLYVEGSAGLDANLPVHRSIGGIATLDTVHYGVRPNLDTGTIPIYVAVTVGVTLGPVAVTVERLGLEAKLAFPRDNTGNLGPAHVAFGFKPPRGARLRIDSAAVVGGGYLFFDREAEQYAGTLQLKVGSLTLSAIGLLTTRLPDGSPGYSLLLIITGEFPPIQLGYGFTLTGVGGLLGVNRSTNVEALRAGVRTGATRSILFPRDPVRNAPQLISDLGRIFPPTANRYVFGPMAKLVWGTPTIVTAEIGVMLELPSPVRLLLLGRISAVLPEQKRPVLTLNMDSVGIIDFGEGDASVDATIYDSRLVTFPLTGDMAMRANWAQRPGFALSVGGFNPRFTPPPNFPQLRRVVVDLGSGDNPRIRLMGYFALTSNTVQVGAQADLYAAIAGFSVSGVLEFDTLFQFNPFRFTFDYRVGVALKRGKRTLMAVSLSGELSGPTPWHITGRAKFKIWPISFSVGFDKKFGPSAQPSPIPPADVLGELTRALEDERNWDAQLPTSGESVVSLRDVDPREDGILAHPLGSVRVRQRVVPLGPRIDKYGNATPVTHRQFTISEFRVAGDPRRLNEKSVPVRERFAPAQYFELSDPLSRPGFEEYDAGRAAIADRMSYGGEEDPTLTATTTLEYETSYIDKKHEVFADDGSPNLGRIGTPAETVDELLQVGAVATADTRTTGREKFVGPDQSVGVSETEYVVVRRSNLTIIREGPLPARPTSYIEAKQAKAAYADHRSDTETSDDLQVVAAHEAQGLWP